MTTARRRLLRAHDTFLRQAVAHVTRLEIDGKKPEQIVAVSLGVRMLRFGIAIQELANAGRAEEAEPLLRSLLSATASILYLANGSLAGRALAYLTHLEDLNQKRAAEKEKLQITIGPDEARLLSHGSDFVSQLRTEFRSRGIAEEKAGKGDTWTGLNDKQLLENIGKQDWYITDYRSLSDAVHVNVLGLFDDMAAVGTGRDPFAQRLDHPFRIFVLTSTYIKEGLAAMDKIWGLERKQRIRKYGRALMGPLLDAYIAKRTRGE